MSDHDDDNGDSTNGHNHDLVPVSDERATSLERRMGLLALEMENLQGSLNAFRTKFNRHAELVEDFMRAIDSKLNDALNNTHGYGVLKRLGAIEDALASKPKRTRAGRK